MSDNIILIVFVVVSLLLPRIPVVGKFFNIINTGLHEFGHALMALLLDGEVNKIELFKDTSGSTVTQTKHKAAAFLISLAGYPFAASVGWFSFYLVKHGAATGLVIGLTVLFVVMLLFWIRNWYGALWVVLFTGITALLLFLDDAQYAEYVAMFYAVMILTESVVSSVVLLVLSFKDSSKAGDATNLANLTHVPAAIWSLLFLAYTLWVVCRVVMMMV
ncbi:MAG: M50 family metallopeptidase [Bacteroidales bacterium]|nr:M50 family metallopeptidase [Bacteroidales bacterium]